MKENQEMPASPAAHENRQFENEPREVLIQEIERLKTANKKLAEENVLLEAAKNKFAGEVARLDDIATKDFLTGVYSRRGFTEEVNRIIPEAGGKRHVKEYKPVSVMILDIDKFKDINDAHGHAGGDEVLRQTVAFLKEKLRDTDIICRWGGDEFVVALQDFTAQQIIERFYDKEAKRAHMSFNVLVGQQTIPVTLSGGAVDRLPAEEIENIIQRADKELYRAKEEGRNRIRTED